MYLNVFTLYLLMHSSILLCEASKRLSGAVDRFEAMWRNDGGGREIADNSENNNTGQWFLPQRGRPPHDEIGLPIQPPDKKSRLKRDDVIDPSLYENKWTPNDFYGIRAEAVLGIYNKGEYPYDQERKYSYGVQLQPKLLLTLCSVVTYVENEDSHVTAWYHAPVRTSVTKCDVNDIVIYIMEIGHQAESRKATQILIHPGCDSWYDTDVAVVAFDKPLRNSRNVWIHTAENLIFRRNLDRAVAAQAVLGKCEVPVYTHSVSDDGKKLIYEVDYVDVHFQHWSGCRTGVCPYWGPRPKQRRLQDPTRCNNLLNGTRYCMVWTIPESLCGLAPGTPVFCDIGSIHGLMGFLSNETYLCRGFFDKSSIMVGLVDAIGWIRETLQIRLSSNYEKSIPQWMINLRENYTSHVAPRIRPIAPTKPSPNMVYDDFLGHTSLSMVNVYVKNYLKCTGTLVSSLVAIVPCSCITTNPYNMSEPAMIKTPSIYLTHEDLSGITVSLMVNGSNPRVKTVNMEVGVDCDTHYASDYGLLHLAETIPHYKLAWVMTKNDKVFRDMLRILAVTDSAMGYDCYWMANMDPGDRTTVKNKIRFVHWTQCLSIVCPNDSWLFLQQDRCFGPEPWNIHSKDSKYCVESADRRQPACTIKSGTPIFCNVEHARGFVGFISKGMDLNPTPCRERPVANQTAVFMGIDKFLPTFASSLWMDEMETFIRENVFSRNISPTLVSSWESIFGVIMVSFVTCNILKK